MIDVHHRKIPKGTATDSADTTDRPLIYLDSCSTADRRRGVPIPVPPCTIPYIVSHNSAMVNCMHLCIVLTSSSARCHEMVTGHMARYTTCMPVVPRLERALFQQQGGLHCYS